MAALGADAQGAGHSLTVNNGGWSGGLLADGASPQGEESKEKGESAVRSTGNGHDHRGCGCRRNRAPSFPLAFFPLRASAVSQ